MTTSVSKSINYKTAPTFNKVLKKTSAKGTARVLPKKLAQLKCKLQNLRSQEPFETQVQNGLNEIKNRGPSQETQSLIDKLEHQLSDKNDKKAPKFEVLRSMLSQIHHGLKNQKLEAIQETISKKVAPVTSSEVKAAIVQKVSDEANHDHDHVMRRIDPN